MNMNAREAYKKVISFDDDSNIPDKVNEKHIEYVMSIINMSIDAQQLETTIVFPLSNSSIQVDNGILFRGQEFFDTLDDVAIIRRYLISQEYKVSKIFKNEYGDPAFKVSWDFQDD